jgi:hypothetical protein
VADIRTYTEAEDGVEHIEVLYGFPKNNALLTAIGVTPMTVMPRPIRRSAASSITTSSPMC